MVKEFFTGAGRRNGATAHQGRDGAEFSNAERKLGHGSLTLLRSPHCGNMAPGQAGPDFAVQPALQE
jgi:hypothetical protein